MFAVGEVIPNWVEYGVLGLIILGLVSKQLIPGWLYNDVKSENRELKAENRKLVELVLETQSKTLPALQEGTSAVRQALEELRFLRRGGS